MLQLLHPIWLIAMAGILFPVIIHLWNNRQRKVLQIGSISFLEKGSLRQSRTRRISDWLLLLLRCLLLLLLALLLSGPFWQLSSTSHKTKGWVLGVKEEGKAPVYKTLIDSLLKAGYQWKEWGASSGQTAGSKEGSAGRLPPSYWDLFRAADQEAPAGVPFYIFTGGERWGFTGSRPVTGRMVHWYVYPPTLDSAVQWIRQAWLSSPDSIRVQTGSSRPTGNSYSVDLLPAKGGTYPGPEGALVGNGGYHVRRLNGILSVALDSQTAVVVDTATLRVRIFADDKYKRDGGYLAAALVALKQFTRRNMQVSVDGSITGLTAGDGPQALSALSGPAVSSEVLPRPDWIFWLSASSLPVGLTAPNVLCYEGGKEIHVDTWMQDINGVEVSRRVANDSPKGAGDTDTLKRGVEIDSLKRGENTDSLKGGENTDLWKDGFGRPLLSVQQRAEGRIFHFYSHFDPEWNGLVWSPRFPVLLEELMREEVTTDGQTFLPGHRATEDSGRLQIGFDRRVLDPEQIQPEFIPAGMDAAERGTAGMQAAGGMAGLTADQQVSAASTMDLAPVCWTLLFLIFLMERILALRSPKIKNDG